MPQRIDDVFGVIHIGSVALSLTIARYRGLHDIETIQYARREVDFGEEVFRTGGLSFTSIRQMCRILNGFRRILKEHGVKESTVYATAVLREAKNRRMIGDLIRVHTGYDVQVLDMPQEIYYKHFALHDALMHPRTGDGLIDEETVLFVDITSGAVGFTVWRGGHLAYQQNVHIGTLRLLENYDRNQRDDVAFPTVVSESIHHMLAPIWPILRSFSIATLALSGRESRLVSRLMGVGERQEMTVVSPVRFERIFQELSDLSTARLAKACGVTERQAQGLLPTLHLYAEILRHVNVERLIMMKTSFLEGTVKYTGALRHEEPSLLFLRDELLHLARAIAERYDSHMPHLDFLEQQCLLFLNALRPLHGLLERDGYLLRMAVLLHQVGRYVNLRRNHEHAYHIIKGTDIFGLTDLEKEIVATVVYYSYKGNPSDEDACYRHLPEQVKMTVSKLVAILRLCKALDWSELQKMTKITAELKRDMLCVSYVSKWDTTLEEWTFQTETALCKEVFGIDAVLERRTTDDGYFIS